MAHRKTVHPLSFQAVRLVADLCLEYQVYDPQLWNSLLQKLLGFNLVRGHAPEQSFDSHN